MQFLSNKKVDDKSMKILHVAFGRPPFYTGGLVRYAEDLLMQQLDMGHCIEFIYPGHSALSKKTCINTTIDKSGLVIHEIVNPLPMAIVSGVGEPKRYCTPCNSDCFDNFFDETKPDIIHVHSFMGIHKEFFQSAKKRNIRLIFTTHDYYPICLRYSLLDRNNQLCYEHSPEKCMNCNKGMGLPPLWEKLIRSKIYKYLKYTSVFKKLRLIGRRLMNSGENVLKQDNITNECMLESTKENAIITDNIKCSDKEKVGDYSKLINYYEDILNMMDLIHCNSKLTYKIYKKYFPKLKYNVIAITHKDMPKRAKVKRNNDCNFRIGYLNGMVAHKGINTLLDAFNKLQDSDCIKWKLQLWGDDYSCISDNQRIYNNGKYVIDKIDVVLSSMDLLVVPSLWWETFGFVVLEALAYGIPVVCSDRVGASMLLTDSPIKLIYQEEDSRELATIIENMSNYGVYESVTEFISRLKVHTEMKEHTEEILNLYQENE